MNTSLVAAVGHGSTAYWYLTRSTGIVSLVLLSGTLILGMVASVGWTTIRWPRFLSQSIHRNLSLLCIVFIGIHVVTTVADGYVPINYADAFIPFLSSYRPLWIGMGAVALDLLLAVGITSGLRRRIGSHAWRLVHWLAYLCWPIAVLHALGSGSDTRLSVAMLIEAACVLAVVLTGIWRLVTGEARSPSWRLGIGAAGLIGIAAIGLFALLGPYRPGWSTRAGTSAAVLAQINSSASIPATTGTPSSGTTATTNAAPSVLPSSSFTASVSGTYHSSPATGGQVDVVLTVTVEGIGGGPLTVDLRGDPLNGGVAMTSSKVTWDGTTGVVTALRGSNISAAISGQGRSFTLAMDLVLHASSGLVTGTVAATVEGDSQ